MYFLERAKGVAMQSIMIMPSTQPMASTAVTSATVQNTVQNRVVKSVEPQHSLEPQHIEKKSQKDSEPIKAEQVSQEFNDISKDLNLDVKFAYNAKIDTVYINVTDKNTGEIIKKLPTEEAMKIKESMKDLVGVLFDKKG